MFIFYQRSLAVLFLIPLGGLQASDFQEDGATNSGYSIGALKAQPNKMDLSYITRSPEVNDQGIGQSDPAFQRMWNLFQDVVNEYPGPEKNNCFKPVRSALDALYNRGLEGDERCCMDYIYAHTTFYAETSDQQKSAQARLRLNNLNATILEEKIPNRFFDTEMKAGILYMLGHMNSHGEGGPVNKSSAFQYFTTLQQEQYSGTISQAHGLFFLAELSSMQNKYANAIVAFKSIINNPMLPEKKKIGSIFRLAYMQFYGLENDKDHASARNGFKIVSESPHATEEKKMIALSLLTRMQFHGWGGEQDHIAARKGYKSVSESPYTPEEHKINSLLKLAEMQYHGLGGDQDYTSARKGWKSVLESQRPSENQKIFALSILSHMQYHGLGGDQDYTSARKGWKSVLESQRASENQKIFALSILSHMQYHGLGGDQDHISARKGFEIVSKSPYTPEDHKIVALSNLSHMQIHGLGGAHNHASARKGCKIVSKSPYAPENEKINSLLKLAEMQYYGWGGAQDYVAAERNLRNCLENGGTMIEVKNKIPHIEDMLNTIKATRNNNSMNPRPGPAVGGSVLQKRTAPGSDENPSQPKRARGSD